jgi:hypothetical protein
MAFLGKTLLVALVFLLAATPSFAMSNCTVDSDCSGGRGLCVSPPLSTKYCACGSGFGGSQCELLPAASCSFAPVTQSSGSFQAIADISYVHPSLTININANLQANSFVDPSSNTPTLQDNTTAISMQTIVVFGDGSHPECDYPNGNQGVAWNDLAATSDTCSDKFVGVVSWTDAKTKCGFVDVYGNRTYEQTIHITRTFYLGTIRGEAIFRNETISRTLQVIFPTEVDIFSSRTQVTGAPGILSALTGVSFDPSSTPEKWTVTFQTSVQAPFKLSNPTLFSVTNQLLSDERYINGSHLLVDLSQCNNNSLDCTQQVSVNFGQGLAGDACDALAGNITLQFEVTCSEGLGINCPIQTPEIALVTVILQTGDSCPVTEQIRFTVTNITAYGDAAVTRLQTSFLTSATVYFGADVQTDQAVISSRLVKSNSVCISLSTNTLQCTPVNYTVEASAGGKDPVFAIAFSQNSAIFGALDSGVASSEYYVVKATIQVFFEETTKRNSPEEMEVSFIQQRAVTTQKSTATTLKTSPILVAHDELTNQPSELSDSTTASPLVLFGMAIVGTIALL